MKKEGENKEEWKGRERREDKGAEVGIFDLFALENKRRCR